MTDHRTNEYVGKPVFTLVDGIAWMKWPDGHTARPLEFEYVREIERQQARANNHAETLRGIADMDPATEGDRMRLWARDALSGYTETAEVSMKKQQDEINRLRGVIKDAAERKLDVPNGIWSMEHSWSILKSDLLSALDVSMKP